MSNHAICTIVTKPYLAFARALARSLAKHNRQMPFYVLLADRLDDYFDPAKEAFRVVSLDQLAEQSSIGRMSFYYTPFEFCNAVRPLLHRYLLENTEHDAWLYLDSDIMVCGSLEPVFNELQKASILLNPHCTTPPHNPAPVETSIARHGVFNSGCLGLRRSATAVRFVEWFRSRLEFHCLHERGLFVDQIWLNLVPMYFPEVAPLTHPGANVAYWNLHERDLAKDAEDRILVNGRPLLFAHFSGADLACSDQVTTLLDGFDFRAPPIWKELHGQYVTRLRSCGMELTRAYPYAFDRFTDGTPITRHMRRLYYRDCLAGAGGQQSAFLRAREFRNRMRRHRLRNALARQYRFAKRMLGPTWRGVQNLAGLRGLAGTCRPS